MKKKKRDKHKEQCEHQKHENKNIFQNEEKIRFQVAHVPKRHCFVCTSSGQDEFIYDIECNAIDVSVMLIFHDMHRLVWILFADIPNHEFLVIADTANHVGIAFVPVHIFNDTYQSANFWIKPFWSMEYCINRSGGNTSPRLQSLNLHHP
jgi:hypothetical protein